MRKKIIELFFLFNPISFNWDNRKPGSEVFSHYPDFFQNYIGKSYLFVHIYIYDKKMKGGK